MDHLKKPSLDAMRPEGVPLAEAFMAWRRERVDITRVEASPILDHKQPFSETWADWKAFKSLVQPDDALWTFCSPQEDWDRHIGWQGLLLVRGGKIAEFLVTAQN